MGNGMPQRNRNRKFARASLRATFGVFPVVAGGLAAAYAEETGDFGI
jgi:hypothetical protein